MSLDNRERPRRNRSNQEVWPKWMWVAVPVLVIFVVAGLWWAIFSPPSADEGSPTPTPTPRVGAVQPTQTLGEESPEGKETVIATVPPLDTPTPTVRPTSTPEPEPTQAPIAVEDTVEVSGTGGSGLRMRAGAGQGHDVVKLLQEGAVLEVIGGPKEADGFTWWQVRDEVGESGWVASTYVSRQ